MIEKISFKEKSNKGITLVALVVTIIVLIILAGISINLVLGENGIITRAKHAKEKTELAQTEEQTEINELLSEWDKIIGESNKKIQPGESGYQGGNYDDPYIPIGFKHKEGTWNNGYTIIGETQSIGNEFVWVPCVLDQSKVKEGDTVVTFTKSMHSKYNAENLIITGEEDNTASELETSVGSYGGFYIAKYEAGIEGTIENYSLTTKKPVDGSVKPLSQQGKGLWNNISRDSAIIVSKAMIDEEKSKSKSALISGAAWDTTLNWMVNASENKNNEPNLSYDINSNRKGWYNHVASTTIHTTGFFSVNNIFDMGGNVWEWTTENCTKSSVSYLVIRGGRFYDNGSELPAAYRSYGGNFEDYSVGFRVMMYKSV